MFDEIDIPEDLSGLSVSELQALLDQINEAGKTTAEAAREAEGDERAELVATLEQLREAKAKVKEALTTAEAAEAEAEKAIEEAAAEFDGDSEEESDDQDTEEDDEADDTESSEATSEAEDKEPVTAAGTIRVPARRRELPQARKPSDKLSSPFRTSGGDRVNSLGQLAEMFQRAAKAAGMNGDGMARVARFSRVPEELGLEIVHGVDARRNTAIMNAAVSQDDLVMAAGGFCGPAEVLTDIPTCGRTDRPVGSRIPSINARGKFRYMRSLGLQDVEAGIGLWTEADDIAVDPNVPESLKPCYHLECAEDVEATPIAIPVCFQYGTFQQWSFPEQVAAALRMFDVALARRSESVVLQRLHEQANQFTYVPPAGESVQNGLVRLVGQLMQLIGYNGRNDTDGYTLILPESLVQDIIVDAAIKAWVGPTLTRAQIVGQLEDLFQLEVLLTPDVRYNAPAPVEPLPEAPAPAGGDVPCPHTRKEILLLKLDDFRHGVDDVDIMVQTDIATARQNDKSVFLETIETTEKKGCSPAFSVLYDGIASTGAQPDLVASDPDYCPGPTPEPYGVDPQGFPGDPLVA